MKKILAFFLLAGMSLSATFADLVEINSSYDTDPIDELTRTIADGSYSDPENIDYLKVRKDINESPQTVLVEDYQRLKIKTLYKDSTVLFYPNAKQYYELKNFPNNIRMIKPIHENFAIFMDLDAEDAFENSWKVNCSIDNITDEKICGVLKFEFILMHSSKTGWSLTVSKKIRDLNPYVFHYLRVDKNVPFKTKLIFSGVTVNKIVNQMRTGKTLYTRFYEGRESYEETLSLYGFVAAYETMNLMYSQLK